MPRRNPGGALIITMPARLASGAMQKGEHGVVLDYAVGRALDADGAGRVLTLDVARELRRIYRGRHIARWVEHPKGMRYWAVDRQYLVLRGLAAVLESFECELPDNDLAVSLPATLLDVPRRRNAFLLAAVVAGGGRHLSREYVTRFARVDRKTLSGWKRDPTIWDDILRWEPRWATTA